MITSLACWISLTNAKLILREATTPSHALINKPKLLKYLLGFFYKRSHLIIAGSEGVKLDLVNSFGIKNNMVKVVNNPILSQDLNLKSNELLEHPYFINKFEPVILTVGKVSQAKDYMTLLKAFKLVNEKLSCKLIIVGNKFDESIEYKQLIDFIESQSLLESVDFVGFQENPYNYMKKADVFVLSSKYEGSPGVLIQGLYLNGNVVSTDCKSGPREILENGKFGRLVPVGDYNLMCLAILDAIRSPYSFCNAITLRSFDIDISCKKYWEAINS